ncbi:hypothetical protein QFC19_001857 [Naganishia cerealis]|uniref:Uncharacterized protein n=1 Tax=Naganishia cerealis TaxID=610337 RepID=A0ACC2WEP4_9TREE|nr:hypothetical protein QFC19_001857 [Naganishia cerealis]
MAETETAPPRPPHSEIPLDQTGNAVLENTQAQPTVKGSKGSDVKPQECRADPALVELNAQLYARGLTRSGLKLEGLNSKARDQVMKVISKLLSQRADDFSQLEAMQTSHRVLAHDLDRLTELHKQLKHRVIIAEKDRELARSQVTSLSQKLKREEQAHKLARDDFGRAQTALTLVRTQAQHDMKKREVQVERTLQHWQRTASENARMLSSGYRAGIICLNPIESPEQAPRVVTHTWCNPNRCRQILTFSHFQDSLFDPNIRELNHQMISLQEECEAFRHVTLSTANQLIKLEALAKREPEPSRLDAATFFKAHPLNSSQTSSSTSHPLTADNRLREIISRVRSCIEIDVAAKEEAERVKKDLLMEMVNSYEGERVERVKELMEQKMRDLVDGLEQARTHDRTPPSTYEEKDATPPPIPGIVNAEQAKLAQEKDELDREKVSVQAEGKRVTETLVRLAKDRALFEIERNGFLEERRKFEMEKVMTEPPRLDDMPIHRTSEEDNQRSDSTSREPPRTPEKRDKSASYETVSDGDSGSSCASSLSLEGKDKISPIKANTRPVVSSPLANSTAARHVTSKMRSPLHRRRTIKGPSTPLARFVSHKIVAEKLASAKKLKALQATEPQTTEHESVGSSTARPVSRVITAKAPRSTTLTAPTSSSALRSTTKANERLLSSQARGATTRNPAELAKSHSSTEGEQPRVSTIRRGPSTANSTGQQACVSTAGPVGKVPSTLKVVRKLEVGQGDGMGPRNAASQTGRSW